MLFFKGFKKVRIEVIFVPPSVGLNWNIESENENKKEIKQ